MALRSYGLTALFTEIHIANFTLNSIVFSEILITNWYSYQSYSSTFSSTFKGFNSLKILEIDIFRSIIFRWIGIHVQKRSNSFQSGPNRWKLDPASVCNDYNSFALNTEEKVKLKLSNQRSRAAAGRTDPLFKRWNIKTVGKKNQPK